MHPSFNFEYYGIKCHVTSDIPEFMNTIAQKFSGFSLTNTETLFSSQVQVSIRQDSPPQILNANKLSQFTWKTDNSLRLEHRYLETNTTIDFYFTQNKLTTINIYYVPHIQFSALNHLLRKRLSKQLFHNLSKQYIEQSLLWIIQENANIRCIHASAVLKNNKVYIFAGQNGVGKSTLAQLLIKKYGYQLFADNYLLHSTNVAFFSPDVVRLDKKSIDAINSDSIAEFGFDKFEIAKQDKPEISKAKIQAVYFMTQGSSWHIEKSDKMLYETIKQLEYVHHEAIEIAPISQWNSRFKSPQTPQAQFYHLTAGSITSFCEKDLQL